MAGSRPRAGWTTLDIEQAADLVPFLKAGMAGLSRSRWRPGDPVEYLAAPIVLAVLVTVARECGLRELNEMRHERERAVVGPAGQAPADVPVVPVDAERSAAAVRSADLDDDRSGPVQAAGPAKGAVVTDRHTGYLVVLDRDVREDDAEEGVLAALRMIKGVARVVPVTGDPATQVAETRRDIAWQQALHQLVMDGPAQQDGGS